MKPIAILFCIAILSIFIAHSCNKDDETVKQASQNTPGITFEIDSTIEDSVVHITDKK